MFRSRILQLVSWFFAVSFFAWGLLDPRFRDPEGFLSGNFCLPIAIGIALTVLGWGTTRKWKRPTFWFALALIGQAVTLQLILAGKKAGYQHYEPLHLLITDTQSSLLLAYLVLQTVVVFWGLSKIWSSLKAWVARTFGFWQLLGMLLIVFLPAATVSRQISVYVSELVFAAFIQALNLGSILLLAWSLPNESLLCWKERFDAWFGGPNVKELPHAPRLDRFALGAACWAMCVAALLAWYSYERHPHIPDEVSYLYQARYFAEGMLTMPAPPAPDAFNLDLMTYESDRWYSPFPPGWPLVLALGFLVGLPWLMNPLLGGLNILLTYSFVQEMYNRRLARIVILLLCTSPWYIFMAMNYMSHMLSLFCALIAALAVVKARRTGKVSWGWLGGVALGGASLIRPLEALIMAGLLGLWALGIGGLRLKSASLAGLVFGALAIGALNFPYNQHLTGDSLTFPVMAYFDKYYGPNINALGFGPNRGLTWAIDPFPGHSPLDALVNTNLNTFSVNIDLFGWGTGSLILIAIILCAGKLQNNDYLMVAVIGTVIAVHGLYWFSGGPGFGARYWFLIIIPCIVLTARGISLLEHKLASGTTALAHKSATVMVAILSLCVLSVINFFPWRAIDKYHHYRGMRPDIRHLAHDNNFRKSLVLIKGNRHTDYASAATYNPIDLHADQPVYAWGRGSQTLSQLVNAYPDRSFWVIAGPSVTCKGFHVIEGPLKGVDLIAKSHKFQLGKPHLASMSDDKH